MDVLVVILRLNAETCDSVDTLRASLDVLLVDSMVGRRSTTSALHSSKTPLVKCLPHRKINPDQDATEGAAQLAVRLLGLDNACQIRRVVSVSLLYNEAGMSCTTVDCAVCGYGAALFCVPVLAGDDVCDVSGAAATTVFLPFAQTLSSCQDSDCGDIDVESKHLLLRVDEWLKERTDNDNRFISSLFYRSATAKRLRTCVHNPAHLKESRWCYKRQAVEAMERPAMVTVEMVSDGSGPRDDSHDSSALDTSDLAEEVRFANVVFAYMMALEKCDVFIMNPLFGSSIPYKVAQDQMVVDYFAKGRPELSPRSLNRTHSSNDSSESGNWMDEYPLHRAAYLDKPDLIKYYLAQSCDPNQPDRDSWTPLHYASWYGNLSAVQALLNYGKCSVNLRNKNGSTPLHFAAWCGHRYVTELLLTHPDINVTIRDNDGKTPADLCECVPKEDWLAVATLLKNSIDGKLPKIQIDLLDGSNIMLPLINGKDTTAMELQREIIQELKLEDRCANLFTLWISSPSLQLQLKADHKPIQHLLKWKEKILPQWLDCQDSSSEEPKLSFRRNARISLAEERQIKLNDSALALLFHEAHNNFVNGLYPCENQDVIYLSAVIIQIIHGDFDSKKDRQLFKNESTLRSLLPCHKLKERSVNWASKIMAEHKSLRNKTQKSLPALQLKFLSFCQNLRVYGSAFFDAMIFVSKPIKGALRVHVGINDFGMHFINYETKALYSSFPHSSICWVYHSDKPYIEFSAKEGALHVFTLRTRQVSLIHTLLSRWNENAK